ncbi:MAG: LPS export ABC transporter periplasmic protein LptC [Candidatus Malihini olakiniferum]
MKKIKRFLALLALIVLIPTIWKMIDKNKKLQTKIQGKTAPIYISDEITTCMYNLQGGLNYRLVAQKVEYFNEEQLACFTSPIATLFNEQNIATWSVQSNYAKLIKDKILFLSGHVEFNSLTNDSQLWQIKTDNAQVNLVTQDIASDDEVMLYGDKFLSDGMKMRGNFRKKTAELIEKVKTSYEIQHQ